MTPRSFRWTWTGMFAVVFATTVGAQPLPSERSAFVATTDFNDGSATSLNLSAAPGLSTSTLDVMDTSGDPAAVWSNGLFVIHRAFAGTKANRIEQIDPQSFQVERTLATGENPQDLELIGNTLYVSLLEDPSGLQTCSLASGTCSGSIDVCAGLPVGPDGNCEATQILRDGATLYVLLGLLDDLSVVRNGKIAVVDTSTNSVGTLDLSTRNPSNLAMLSDGRLLVSSSGSFFPSDLSGGVEIVNPKTGESDLILDDDVLGGNVSDLVLLDDLNAYVIVTDPNTFVPRVVRFSPLLAELGAPVVQTTYSGSTFFIGDIAADGAGNVLVADTVNLAAPRIIRIEGLSGLPIDVFDSGKFAPFSIASFPTP